MECERDLRGARLSGRADRRCAVIGVGRAYPMAIAFFAIVDMGAQCAGFVFDAADSVGWRVGWHIAGAERAFMSAASAARRLLIR